MRLFTKLSLAAAAAVTLAACDTLTGGPLIRPGEATGFIEVVNVGSDRIDAVVMSECGAMSYGFNRLADGAFIPVGGSARFELSAGCWDVGAGTFGTSEGYKRITISPGVTLQLNVT